MITPEQIDECLNQFKDENGYVAGNQLEKQVDAVLDVLKKSAVFHEFALECAQRVGVSLNEIIGIVGAAIMHGYFLGRLPDIDEDITNLPPTKGSA